jgi:hypothetical protein
MAQCQLGRPDEARAALAKAIEIIDTNSPKPGSSDLGEEWFNWIHARLLLEEAKRFIQTPPDA